LKEEEFDPGDRGGFWTFGHLGFLCRASTIIPSIFGERFTCHLIYWSLARVGEKEGALQKGVSSVWRSRSSLFSWRLHQGVCLAPIYIPSKFHSIWRLPAVRPNYWVSAVIQEGATQFGVSVIGGADLYLSA
jgi:hypothetical protein